MHLLIPPPALNSPLQRCTPLTPSRRGCRRCAPAAASPRCSRCLGSTALAATRRGAAALALSCFETTCFQLASSNPGRARLPSPLLTLAAPIRCVQSGGGRSLYAGIWGNLVGVAPASAIFMAVYEPTKQVNSLPGSSPLAGAATAPRPPCLLMAPTTPGQWHPQHTCATALPHAAAAARLISVPCLNFRGLRLLPPLPCSLCCSGWASSSSSWGRWRAAWRQASPPPSCACPLRW